MSYLSRLSNLKAGLDAQNSQYQAEQDNFSRDASKMEEVARAKVEDYARNLEQAGGLGFGIIRGGKSVKALYNKWRGKKEPETQETQETQETEVSNNDVDSNLPIDENIGNEELPTGNEEISTETGPEENLEEQGPELTGENELIADTTNLPSQIEMNDVSNFGQTQGTATLEQDSNIIQSTPTQNAILNSDPETNMSVEDSTDSLASQTGGDITSELTGDVVADSVSEGSSALVDGLAIAGDVVLDAIPVVGEVAMVATAVAGFFEGIFGSHDQPIQPPPSIISKVGVDASSMVQKTPTVPGLV